MLEGGQARALNAVELIAELLAKVDMPISLFEIRLVLAAIIFAHQKVHKLFGEREEENGHC